MPRLRLLCFFIIIFTVTNTYGQSDSCEEITHRTLPVLHTALQNNDFDQIEKSLSAIERICGYTEFTQRIRILSLMIQRANTQTEITKYLDRKFDEQLIERLENAAQPNYRILYQKDEKAFDYVPLRHPIDSLAQVKATAILGSEQYKLNTVEQSLALLFSDHVKTYLDRTSRQQQPRKATRGSRIQSYARDGGIYLSGGMYTPLNAVNPVFGTNPVFGVGFISDLDEDFILDLFFKARLNNNDRDFEYGFYDNVEWVNSTASYMLGGSVGYKFLDMGRFLSIAKVGIASERVNTGLSETIYVDQGLWTSSRTKRHRMRTYNISAGLSVMQHLQGKSFIGVQGQYHYSPYNRNRQLFTPIASDYVSLELFIKF